MQLDLAGIARAVVVNNMGVGGIELRVRGAVADGRATLIETSQALPVRGGPATSSQPWLVFDVEGWESPATVGLAWKTERADPM